MDGTTLYASNLNQFASAKINLNIKCALNLRLSREHFGESREDDAHIQSGRLKAEWRSRESGRGRACNAEEQKIHKNTF